MFRSLLHPHERGIVDSKDKEKEILRYYELEYLVEYLVGRPSLSG
jgi:hypothetical protein